MLAQAVLHIPGHMTRAGFLPGLPRSRAVVRMQSLNPAMTNRRIRGLSGISLPLGVEPFDGTVGTRDPGDGRNTIGKHQQRFLGAMLLGDFMPLNEDAIDGTRRIGQRLVNEINISLGQRGAVLPVDQQAK